MRFDQHDTTRDVAAVNSPTCDVSKSEELRLSDISYDILLQKTIKLRET